MGCRTGTPGHMTNNQQKIHGQHRILYTNNNGFTGEAGFTHGMLHGNTWLTVITRYIATQDTVAIHETLATQNTLQNRIH